MVFLLKKNLNLFMKDSGKIITKNQAFKLINQVIIKVDSIIIKNKEQANLNGGTKNITKDNGSMEKNTEKDTGNLLMEMNIREIGLKEKFKVKVFIPLLMDKNTKEPLKII